MLGYYAYLHVVHDDVMHLWLCLVIHVVGVILRLFILFYYLVT
jgi:hypothetical protein